MDHNEQLSCHEDKLSELEKRIIRVEDALSILAPRLLAPEPSAPEPPALPNILPSDPGHQT